MTKIAINMAIPLREYANPRRAAQAIRRAHPIKDGYLTIEPPTEAGDKWVMVAWPVDGYETDAFERAVVDLRRNQQNTLEKLRQRKILRSE